MIQNSTTDTNEPRQPITINNGIDVFSGMLISPIRTLNMLSTQPSIELSSLIGPIFIVALAGLAEGTMSANFSSSALIIGLSLFGSVIERMCFWFVLILFLILLAAFLKQQISLRSCYLVTGWSFAPLIFEGITTCFSNATEFGGILSWCLSIWFLLLQLFAFDSVLRLGRLKTLGVVLILPPCLFFAYFISMLFAGVMISDGFF